MIFNELYQSLSAYSMNYIIIELDIDIHPCYHTC